MTSGFSLLATLGCLTFHEPVDQFISTIEMLVIRPTPSMHTTYVWDGPTPSRSGARFSSPRLGTS